VSLLLFVTKKQEDQCHVMRRGRTRLLVTHQTQWLHACDRVMVVRNGAIVADGPWNQLMADTSLVELHVAPGDGYMDPDAASEGFGNFGGKQQSKRLESETSSDDGSSMEFLQPPAALNEMVNNTSGMPGCGGKERKASEGAQAQVQAFSLTRTLMDDTRHGQKSPDVVSQSSRVIEQGTRLVPNADLLAPSNVPPEETSAMHEALQALGGMAPVSGGPSSTAVERLVSLPSSAATPAAAADYLVDPSLLASGSVSPGEMGAQAGGAQMMPRGLRDPGASWPLQDASSRHFLRRPFQGGISNKRPESRHVADEIQAPLSEEPGWDLQQHGRLAQAGSEAQDADAFVARGQSAEVADPQLLAGQAAHATLLGGAVMPEESTVSEGPALRSYPIGEGLEGGGNPLASLFCERDVFVLESHELSRSSTPEPGIPTTVQGNALELEAVGPCRGFAPFANPMGGGLGCLHCEGGICSCLDNLLDCSSACKSWSGHVKHMSQVLDASHGPPRGFVGSPTSLQRCLPAVASRACFSSNQCPQLRRASACAPIAGSTDGPTSEGSGDGSLRRDGGGAHAAGPVAESFQSGRSVGAVSAIVLRRSDHSGGAEQLDQEENGVETPSGGGESRADAARGDISAGKDRAPSLQNGGKKGVGQGNQDSHALTTAEHREIGKVSRGVYGAYFKAVGGFNFLAVLAALLTGQCLWILSEWWLACWAEADDDEQSRDMRKWLLVYGLFVAGALPPVRYEVLQQFFAEFQVLFLLELDMA
jgi:hypothetical protein